MNVEYLTVIKVIAIIVLLIIISKQNLFVKKNGLYKKITLLAIFVIGGYCLYQLFPIISKTNLFVLLFITKFSGLFLIYLVIITIAGFATNKNEYREEEINMREDNILDARDEKVEYKTRFERHSSDLREIIYDLYVQDCKKILKSPATAKFCDKEDLVITKQNGLYTVSGWVDSQNSYGAMIRTRLSIKLAYKDGVFLIKSHASNSAAKSFVGNMAARYIIAIIFTIISFIIFYFIISGF